MSRHKWLTFILILHFLPWPGSQSFFSLFHAHCLPSSHTVVDLEISKVCGYERSEAFYSEFWSGTDETVVYCEIENEVRESESKDDRDHDSLEMFSIDWSARARWIASFQCTGKTLEGLSLIGGNFCFNVIMRC